MTVEILPEFSKATPAVRNCRISATLDDGKQVSEHRKQTMEEIERGTPDEVLETKFERLIRPFLPPATRHQLIKQVWALDRAKRIDPLIDLLIF